MFRQYVSVTLLVSIVALGSSGLLMIILDSFEFQLQMHPVHKVFGIIMCAAGCLHVFLYFEPIKKYLRSKTLLVTGLALSAFMVLLLAVGLSKPIDQGMLDAVEDAMTQVESKQ